MESLNGNLPLHEITIHKFGYEEAARLSSLCLNKTKFYSIFAQGNRYHYYKNKSPWEQRNTPWKRLIEIHQDRNYLIEVVEKIFSCTTSVDDTYITILHDAIGKVSLDEFRLLFIHASLHFDLTAIDDEGNTASGVAIKQASSEACKEYWNTYYEPLIVRLFLELICQHNNAHATSRVSNDDTAETAEFDH